jgi:hypothetical protein
MGNTMIFATETEARERNFKVLDGLRDLFRLLNDHGAVIGRDSARIVVDLSKAPSIMHEEIGEIFRTSSLVAPSGSMSIFGDFQTDDETGTLLLNIGTALKIDGNNVFGKFAAFAEVRAFLESIPAMSKEQSKAFDALHEEMESHFLDLMLKHREAIVEGLFNGNDSPDWTFHDPKGKTLN